MFFKSCFYHLFVVLPLNVRFSSILRFSDVVIGNNSHDPTRETSQQNDLYIFLFCNHTNDDMHCSRALGVLT